MSVLTCLSLPLAWPSVICSEVIHLHCVLSLCALERPHPAEPRPRQLASYSVLFLFQTAPTGISVMLLVLLHLSPPQFVPLLVPRVATRGSKIPLPSSCAHRAQIFQEGLVWGDPKVDAPPPGNLALFPAS